MSKDRPADSSDPQEERRLLRENLRKYLLVSPDSQGGNELVEAVLREYEFRSDVQRHVRLQGDRLFCGLVEQLLSHWGVGVCKNTPPYTSDMWSERPSDRQMRCDLADHHIINASGPAQRRDDMPLVASWVVHELMRQRKSMRLKVPKAFCGFTGLLLIMPSIWTGFDHVKKFLEYSMVADWGEHDTIYWTKAVERAKDQFVDHIKTGDEQFSSDGLLADFIKLEDIPARDKMVPAVFREVFDEPEPFFPFTTNHLREYIHVVPDYPKTLYHVFPLDCIEHVLRNILVLAGKSCTTGVPTDAAREAYINKILRVREAMSSEARKRFDEEEPSDAIGRWHGWDEKAEVAALVKAGACKRREYHAIMEKCHYGLSFPQPDSVYDEWVKARHALLSQITTIEPDGAGIADRVLSTKASAEETASKPPTTPKPVLKIYRPTQQVWIDGKEAPSKRLPPTGVRWEETEMSYAGPLQIIVKLDNGDKVQVTPQVLGLSYKTDPHRAREPYIELIRILDQRGSCRPGQHHNHATKKNLICILRKALRIAFGTKDDPFRFDHKSRTWQLRARVAQVDQSAFLRKAGLDEEKDLPYHKDDRPDQKKSTKPPR